MPWADELTVACANFLETWGWPVSRMTGEQSSFPKVESTIQPVIVMGEHATGLATGTADQPWLSATPAQTFISVTILAAVAAEFGKAHLMNPAGSAVTAYLTRVRYYRAAGVWSLAPLDTALLDTGDSALSKDQSAAAPVCLWRDDTAAALTTPEIWSNVDSIDMQLTHDWTIHPFRLAPGQGIVLQYSVVNTLLRMGMEWVEIPD